mgnify:CR=1 FL=1
MNVFCLQIRSIIEWKIAKRAVAAVYLNLSHIKDRTKVAEKLRVLDN